MTREIIDLQDYTILVEESQATEPTTNSCKFDEPIIAIAFYGEGNVELNVKYKGQQKKYFHTKGLVLSFYADEQVEFIHRVSSEKNLQCILIATAVRNLSKLPNQEGELFAEFLTQLTHPSESFVEGPRFFMTPDMARILDTVFRIQYQGKTKMMFFRSQMTALLAHYFGSISQMEKSSIKDTERKKLFEAKEILANSLESPPSLSDLSRQIGLNSFKLKKNFKELFGVPVFKYLQNERLHKAHELLRSQEFSVQEAAWHVGYDSLSSFSNAFAKKYGFRPSEVRR